MTGLVKRWVGYPGMGHVYGLGVWGLGWIIGVSSNWFLEGIRVLGLNWVGHWVQLSSGSWVVVCLRWVDPMLMGWLRII